MNKKIMIVLGAVIATIFALQMCRSNRAQILLPENEREKVEEMTDVTELPAADKLKDINVDTVTLQENETVVEISESAIENGNDIPYNLQADDTEYLESVIVFGEDNE